MIVFRLLTAVVVVAVAVKGGLVLTKMKVKNISSAAQSFREKEIVG